jgi:hypothetical protein
VVSRAVFIQLPEYPTLILAILFETIKDSFINSFFTNQIGWWWAFVCISQVAGKEVAKLQCSRATFHRFTNFRDPWFIKLWIATIIEININKGFTIHTSGCVKPKFTRAHPLNSRTHISHIWRC